MSLSNVYTTGLQNVGSYQVSGVPFATGSINVSSSAASPLNKPYKISFPSVTKWVQVFNHDPQEALYVGFSRNGLVGNIDGGNCDNNYHFKLPKATVNQTLGANGNGWVSTGQMELKLTEIWLSGSSQDVSVVAGLTYIDNARVFNASPSGSNWSGSVGVG